jgi:hypothetical protein
MNINVFAIKDSTISAIQILMLLELVPQSGFNSKTWQYKMAIS